MLRTMCIFLRAIAGYHNFKFYILKNITENVSLSITYAAITLNELSYNFEYVSAIETSLTIFYKLLG